MKVKKIFLVFNKTIYYEKNTSKLIGNGHTGKLSKR